MGYEGNVIGADTNMQVSRAISPRYAHLVDITQDGLLVLQSCDCAARQGLARRKLA